MARTGTSLRPSLLRTLSISVLCAAALSGCGAKPAAETESPAAAGATARSYSIRGIIEQLPDPDQAGVAFLIRHEAIPDFVNVYGQKTGMDAMTMPFEIADGLSLDGLSVGDPVAFELAVDWESSPAMAITAIQKLPPDTELTLAAE